MSIVTCLPFVYTGNICLSPIIEALFRDLVQSHPVFEKRQVGLASMTGLNENISCVDSVDVMRLEFELEMGTYRARPLSRHLNADLVPSIDRRAKRNAKSRKLLGLVEKLGD